MKKPTAALFVSWAGVQEFGTYLGDSERETVDVGGQVYKKNTLGEWATSPIIRIELAAGMVTKTVGGSSAFGQDPLGVLYSSNRVVNNVRERDECDELAHEDFESARNQAQVIRSTARWLTRQQYRSSR